MTLGAFLLWAATAMTSSSSSSALDLCRELDAEFNTRAMAKPCQSAAEDVTLSVEGRVEALRRLAFAHILNGDEVLAESAFVRMLAFAPSCELPPDAGPRFRQVFGAARVRFLREGKLRASWPALGAVFDQVPSIQVDLADKLGRVVGARIVSEFTARTSGAPAGAQNVVREDRLARSELAPGLVRFTGTVPEPASLPSSGGTVVWRVVFMGWDGRPVELEQPVEGRYQRTPGLEDVEPLDALPWIIGGSVGGAALLGGVAGGVWWCFAEGPCRAQEAWVRVRVQAGPGGVS